MKTSMSMATHVASASGRHLFRVLADQPPHRAFRHFQGIRHGQDLSTGAWAILVTAPVSMLFFFAGPAGLIGIPIGAIVQAAALGALYRYITERRARSTESGVSNA
ncbi:SCO4225 family membrane protein [Streptomyces sparsogenes]|uniref:SCO4225 family membrane protein n=1 Tax=Streptomyces sparsogenes TaxID=67365 RepID=UPI0033F532B6